MGKLADAFKKKYIEDDMAKVMRLQAEWTRFNNAIIDTGTVEYGYIRQDNRTKKFEKVTVRFFVEEITEEEANEIMGERIN